MLHTQLRAFHAVALQGSFTKAAEALRVSQPTLSGQVRALEDAYGIQLFHRRGRGIEITDLGKSLLETTRRYFAVEDEAERLLSTAQGLMGGHLRVGADSPFTVIPLLAGFSRRYPTVEKSISFGNSRSLLNDIVNRQIDIGFLPDVADDNRLHVVPVQRDRLVLIVHQGHPWAHRRSISLDALGQETLLLREKGSRTRAIFEAILADRGVRPAVVLEIGSREAVAEAVSAGLGVGVVNEGEIGHDTRLKKLPVAGERLNVTEYAAYLRDTRHSPTLLALLEYIDEVSSL